MHEVDRHPEVGADPLARHHGVLGRLPVQDYSVARPFGAAAHKLLSVYELGVGERALLARRLLSPADHDRVGRLQFLGPGRRFQRAALALRSSYVASVAPHVRHRPQTGGREVRALHHAERAHLGRARQPHARAGLPPAERESLARPREQGAHRRRGGRDGGFTDQDLPGGHVGQVQERARAPHAGGGGVRGDHAAVAVCGLLREGFRGLGEGLCLLVLLLLGVLLGLLVGRGVAGHVVLPSSGRS